MTKITAELAPLEGKYYGTKIILRNPEGSEAWILVWVNRVGNYKPSERELESLEEGEEYEVCDDHFESETSLNICRKIVAALNEQEV